MERKIAIYIYTGAIFLLLSCSMLLSSAVISSNRKVIERYEKNTKIFYNNVATALYNGFLAPKGLKMVVLEQTVKLLAKVIGGRIEKFGDAYIIETINSLIVLGHGYNGCVQSFRVIPLTALASSKKIVVLGYCTSDQYPYSFDSNTKVYCFHHPLLITVIFKILSVFHLDYSSILRQLSHILHIDYFTLETLWFFYSSSLHYTQLRYFIFHNSISGSTFSSTLHGILFFLLNDPTIAVLDSGGGAGTSPDFNKDNYDPDWAKKYVTNVIRSYFDYPYTYEKMFSVPFVTKGAPLKDACAEYSCPDIYYSFSFDNINASTHWNITVFDENNQEFLWVHFTSAELDELKRQNSQEKLMTVVTLSIESIIFTGLIATVSPVVAILVGIVLETITVCWFEQMYERIDDIIETATINSGDGWIVYTVKNNILCVTSGRWYWYDPDLREGNMWWLKGTIGCLG